MAVEFVDRNTGEVVPTNVVPKNVRRKAITTGKPEEPVKVQRVNLTPVIIFVALVLGFFIGGGIGTNMQQQVDKSAGYTVSCNQ